MPDKFSRGCSRHFVRFLAALTMLGGVAAVGQEPGTNQQSVQHRAVSLQQKADANTQVAGRESSLPGGDSAGRSQHAKGGPMPLDQYPPLFLPAVAYDGGYYLYYVAVADVNGDGHPDVIVADNSECLTCDEGGVGVLLGNGDGTLQPVVIYDSGGYSASSVAVADVNGDGHPDLLVSTGNQANENGAVGVLLGNGDGTFQAAASYGSGGIGATRVAVADLNHDGHLDLVVSNSCQTSTNCDNGGVSVLLGNGDGTFQTAVTYSSGGGIATSVAIADLNHDGYPDLVMSNFCSLPDPNGHDCSTGDTGTVSVLLGNGDGTFRAPVIYDPGGYETTSVVVADVNGDGHPDLVVANACPSPTSCDEGVVGVLLGNGDGTFQAPVLYSSGGFSLWSLAVADLNGDGHLDLAVANSNDAAVLPGNGDGTFQAARSYEDGFGGLGIVGVAIGDLNGDGEPDLVLSDECSGNGCLVVALHIGDIATATTIASSANPSEFMQPVMLTANVSSSSGTPTGTVNFYEGSNELGSAALSTGSASISISSLSVGSHVIAAVYQGSPKFNSSASGPLTQVVTIANTTTTITSSRNPGALNKRITYTAIVTSQYGGADNGSITFADGGVAVATVPLQGNQASYSTSYNARGTHEMTATYPGDSNNAGSVSSTLEERIKGFTSKTMVTTSGSPSQQGQAVTFTATVTPKKGTVPDGELVTFYDRKKMLGSVALAHGQAAYTTSALSAGKHVIKATYPGDNTIEPSSGTVQQVVEK